MYKQDVRLNKNIQCNGLLVSIPRISRMTLAFTTIEIFQLPATDCTNVMQKKSKETNGDRLYKSVNKLII